ncbi:hypothetical protein SAMN05428642_1114 [Flaviramulus basaltis]|uniref:Uncharacterized protein n=1 Tax=Flaviramulus basaltis TaxID=369401 RepID=A0A1K2ITX0_9FLAO|nr:hypothetical protein [Flaviramulus basaltis]SFZ95187.1 hypothetical protein SAMN05428642_1114 [Flaviramulus basaltis]
MKKSFKINAALVFLIVLQLFTSISFGQEKRFSEEYIKKNIKDRGFVNHKYLTSNEKTDFFYAEEPRGPRVLAINNISKDTPVLNLTKTSKTDYIGIVEEVGVFVNYDEENVLYKSLAKKIAEIKPIYHSETKLIIIYEYVKDFAFGSHPEDFWKCDIPICSIYVTRETLDESSEWNLVSEVRFIYNPIHYDAAISVNHALEKGRKVYSSQIAKDIKSANTVSAKPQQIMKGFIYHDDDFWKKSWIWIYPDKGIFSSTSNEIAMETRTTILKHIFQGDFNKIKKKNFIEEYVLAFLFTYSKHCKNYLVDYRTYKLTNTVTKENGAGIKHVSRVEDWGSINVPVRFSDYFSKQYTDYQYGDLLLNDMESLITKLGCNCKEVNQLQENLYQLSQNKSSIQQLNKPPKGEECYFD